MPRLLSRTLLGLAMMALLLVLLFFVITEYLLRDAPVAPPFLTEIPTDIESISRGEYVARTRGCMGCHGERLEGRAFPEWDWVARAVAPNLAQYAREQSADVLNGAIRYAIGADGRELINMPSPMLVNLSDQDLADLIAFLRSLEPVANDLPDSSIGWTFRWNLMRGSEKTMADWVDQVPTLQLSESADPDLQRGEYLAMTTCVECHGYDLRGATLYPPATPDLAVVAGYSPEAFERLMSEGIAADGREDLGLMSLVAKDRFAAFTDADLRALNTYLSSLGAKEKAAGVSWRP